MLSRSLKILRNETEIHFYYNSTFNNFHFLWIKKRKTKRISIEEQRGIDHKERRNAEEAELAYKTEQERIEQEQREEAERIEREATLEKERQQKDIYDKYINNSLSTGSTPYSYCFGRNSSCSDWGCFEIIVRTPCNSDVLVTI